MLTADSYVLIPWRRRRACDWHCVT